MPEITSDIRRTMQLPGTSDALFNIAAMAEHVWPNDELLPLAGQAQHYGLPTRLLDWSRDPLVAAYFAARSGMKRLPSTDSSMKDATCIAVWILDGFLLDDDLESHEPRLGLNLPLTLVTAPASTNPNLRAQRGMFTVWRPPFEGRSFQLVDRRPLDELVTAAFAEAGISSLPHLFYKLTLPLRHVSELWSTIRRCGVNASHLFPDFSGAAESVREDAK